MSISRLRTPNKNTERAIQDIYDKLNQLVDAVNLKPTGATKAVDANNNMRFIEKADGFSMEFKTSKGWVESSSEVSTGFKIKE